MLLYNSQLIISAVISSMKASEPISVAVIYAQTTTSPPRFTDEGALDLGPGHPF